MKKQFIACFLILLAVACTKNAVVKNNSDVYLQSVLSHLRDSVPAAFFNQLDTSHIYLTDPGRASRFVLRIPFAGHPVTSDFVLLRTDRAGAILSGRVVHLEGQVGPLISQGPASSSAASSSAGRATPFAIASGQPTPFATQTIPLALGTAPPGGSPYSGTIRLQSLSGQLVLQSAIVNGYIMAFHQAGTGGLHSSGRIQLDGAGAKTVTLLPAPDADWLPVVVVVGYGGGSAPAPYISLDGLLGNSSSGILAGGGSDAGSGGTSGGGNSGSNSGNGNSSGNNSGNGNSGNSNSGGNTSGGGDGGDPGNGGASNDSSSTAGTTPPLPPYSPLDPFSAPLLRELGALASAPLDLEQEYTNNLEVFDIRKIFNCFDLIPADGATYTVQLCLDLPINSNPQAAMNFSGGVSVGHTFLVVTKSGSGMNITQSFGYYPQSSPSLWSPLSSIPAEIKNNGNQEINGSISMIINSDQFNALRSTAINLSTRPYQLDKSNCSDYALNVFNAARVTPLTMAPFILNQAGIVMGNGMSSDPISLIINNSPQMLYVKLSNMKANGDPEASNIQLDLSHNLSSPPSHGECN